jgi:hypothetical protein
MALLSESQIDDLRIGSLKRRADTVRLKPDPTIANALNHQSSINLQ